MKKILILGASLASSLSVVLGQVGGISASKLATLCANPVPDKTIEFEPAFGFVFSKTAWDKDGNEYDLFPNNDSVFVNSGFGFRFSYGAWENLEIGTALPVDMSGISFGMKYLLPEMGKFSTALVTGLNTPLGNQFFDLKKRHFDNTTAVVGGLVMTYEFTESFSIDFDSQYQMLTKEIDEKHNNDIFLNSDIGYYITEGFQIVAGLNYSSSSFENSDFDSSLLMLNTGVTIERAENFLLVLNMPYDLTGKNINKSIGFGFALTISIN